MNVDHHPTVFSFAPDKEFLQSSQGRDLTKEEILDLNRAGDVHSLLSATVVEISVEEGQEVMVGDRIAIMEAMKMQTPIVAETEGIVTNIYAKAGSVLKPGDRILTIDKDAEE